MIEQDILENQVNPVYLGIGSNLGNKINNIELAKSKLILNESGAVILDIDTDKKSLFVSNKKTEQKLRDLFKK